MNDTTETIEQESERPQEESDRYELRLYVAGQTPKSIMAFNNLKKICEEHMVNIGLRSSTF